MQANDDRTIEVVFSAGAEYRQWWGREQLTVSKKACRLQRLNGPFPPVLMNHDPGEQVGVVESAKIDGEQAVAMLRFSKAHRADEIYQDILDGIRGQISCGYRIIKYEIDESNERDPLYRITEWEPFEISVVPYAADSSCIAKRNDFIQPLTPPPERVDGQPTPPPEDNREDTTDMDPKEALRLAREAGIPELGTRAIEQDWTQEQLEAVIANEQARSADPPPADPPASDPPPADPPPESERGGAPTDPPPDGDDEGDPATPQSNDSGRVTRIYDIGAEFGERDMAIEAIADLNCSIEDFQKRIMEKQKRTKERAMVERKIPERISLDPKDQANFRISDLLYHIASGNKSKRGGQEYDICEEEANLRSKQGIAVEGTPIPQQIFSDHGLYTSNRSLFLAHRILNASTDTAGKHTIDDELLADSFIDILLEHTVATQLVTRMDDLMGNITFPRQDARAVAAWTGETTASTEQNPTFDVITLTPKHLRAWTEVSTTLLHQSSIGVENFVRRDLARAVAKAMDTAIMVGTGSSNQPTGIKSLGTDLNSTKWPADTAGSPPTTNFDYDSLLECEELLSNDDALMGRLAWVSDPKVRRYGRKTAELGAGTSRPCWRNSTMIDYPAYVTTQVEAETAYLANWSEMILGCWGGLDVMANPYSKDKEGIVRFTIGQMCDLAARHAESFCHLTKTT